MQYSPPYRFGFTFLVLFAYWGVAQHKNEISATLKEDSHSIEITQKFTYHNQTGISLSGLYFLDWNNAYSDNSTPLSKKFGEDFDRRLHLATQKERGYTKINSVVTKDYQGLEWHRTPEKDIIAIELKEALRPNQSLTIFFSYEVFLPDSKFTRYGHYPNGNYFLKDWYLTPAVHNKGWLCYNNKGLDDLYTDMAETTVNFKYPKNLQIASNFQLGSEGHFPEGNFAQLKEANRKSIVISLTKEKEFSTYYTQSIEVSSNLDLPRFPDILQSISINQVLGFIEQHLGEYPHKKLMVSSYDYDKNPLYGLNQLPNFIVPYEDEFQFEMMFLKTALNSFLEESLYLDNRKERWVKDAIANYLTIKYVEENFPDQKLIGKLADLWGIRGFHFAKMKFNEQYSFLHMLSARRNVDQALNLPNDSLIIFNQKVANSYKAGLGLAYMAEYLGKEKVDSTILDFYQVKKLNPKTTADDFRIVMESCSDSKLDWFFEEYVSTRKKIDFKIKKVEKTPDSLKVTVKNKRGSLLPISLFGIREDSVVSKYWLTNIDSSKTFVIPRNGEDKLVLNYDNKIPEFNQRDNWKTLNGFLSSNKRLKFTFFKDTEDPNYQQVFFVPIANFNIYDGLTPGLRLYNKTFLERPFTYDITPTYSFLERTLVGGASMRYRHYYDQGRLFMANYQFSGSTSHFQQNSRFTTITPSITFGWRPQDLRSNKRQFLFFRHRNVFRNIDEALANDNTLDLDLENNPDYSIFNTRFTSIDNGLINFKSSEIDFQHSGDFTKISAEFEYRRLFESNRQLNVRFFAGKFLRNRTGSDFFSFALDRPTDYMFDLGYLGRSEQSGIVSQQIIIAEGGFKTLFQDQFADDFIATTNVSFNLWRWIEVYGDIGVVGDKGQNSRFVYDSGIRLNLVTDYFELYLPMYSNLGWEPQLPDYGQRIRFVVTISPRTLTGLLTRKWF